MSGPPIIDRPNVVFRGAESRPGDYAEEVDGIVTFRRRDGRPFLWVPARAFDEPPSGPKPPTASSR